MRVLELARAYASVSDGVGGISPEAHKTSLNALQNVINGKAPFGGGYTQSVRMAQEAGLIESPKARSPFSVKGVAGGLVATFAAGASAAAESGATVESVGNAALNSAIPGAAEARQNNLCGAFGQIAGASAGRGCYGGHCCSRCGCGYGYYSGVRPCCSYCSSSCGYRSYGGGLGRWAWQQKLRLPLRLRLLARLCPRRWA
jgi:hypothetical protein